MTVKSSETSSYKTLALSSLGSTLEFLDFTLYALFARYFSANFFPTQNYFASLIGTFSVFAIGYFARPIGGVIFGHLGDKYGRKKMFTLSVLIMGLATLAIGCLPTYQTIGIAAPVLLLICRILQGISLGGEIPGATIFIAEHFSSHQRSFAVSLIFMSATLGNVIGSIFGYGLSAVINNTQMMLWGWRIPFLFGFLLSILAYFLRKNIAETPIFILLEQQKQIQAIPALHLFRTAPAKCLTALSLCAISASALSLLLYFPTYLSNTFHYSISDFYLGSVLSFLSLAFFTALFGFFANYLGQKKLLLTSAFLTSIFSYYFFNTHLNFTPASFIFFGVGFGLVAGLANGSYGLAIAWLFPAEIRYSGMAIGYNIGFAVFGGLTPLILTTILNATHRLSTVTYLIFTCCVITFLGAIMLPRKN